MARAVVLIAFWEEFVVGPKGESAYSHIYGLFLPKVSTIYVIMLNVIEREQRMPLRRGEEKRSENRERERERQCRTEQEKEKEIKTETERKIEKKKGGGEVKHVPSPNTRQICKISVFPISLSR